MVVVTFLEVDDFEALALILIHRNFGFFDRNKWIVNLERGIFEVFSAVTL